MFRLIIHCVVYPKIVTMIEACNWQNQPAPTSA